MISGLHKHREDWLLMLLQWIVLSSVFINCKYNTAVRWVLCILILIL